ncbi:hypothetical protein A0256_23375 [Mucilaginibacter sp. PAMC 26640]|nr:hypothetical protein A0256_23375 [Mucilaginibacter sp. PAMC 26640]
MNQLSTPITTDNAPRIPFNTLQFGDRFKHSLTGNIHQVFFVPLDSAYFTIRRADGWLVTCERGGFAWDKGVIKV